MKKKRKVKTQDTVWDMAVDAVENHGVPFKVDIIGRNFRLGREMVIKDGECEMPLGIDTEMSTDDVLAEIERLFALFYVSIRSKNSHRSLFAHCKTEPSRNDLLFAERSNKAQLRLELFTLLSVLAGTLKWTEEKFGKHHCWISERNKQLVIYKNWIENEKNVE